MARIPRPSGLPRRISARWWAWRKAPRRFHVRKPASFWVWKKWRQSKPLPPAPKPAPKPDPKPTSVFMYDDVNVALIPKDAKAVAGYIGGHWPTYPKVVSGWPKARHLSIAVSTAYNADCLDVEPGDAPIGLAAAWVKKQLALRKAGNGYNTSKPVVYTSASWGNALNDALKAAGLHIGRDYLWWSAHYDPRQGQHLCSPKCYPGLRYSADATQFTDHALGRSLDESICTAGFFS